jgi:hypothetical protein
MWYVCVVCVCAEYTKDEPILRSTAPLGGDYTWEAETVIAVVGRVIPDPALSMSSSCKISRGVPGQLKYI